MTTPMKRNRLSLALAAAVGLAAVDALAAGLGKITVLSPLGQPLRAELEITATRDELATMSAKLASPEAFKQVGIEYLPAYAGIRFVLDKRPDGQPFLRVLTDRPVNEPFLDILVELNWASGRMVREYTVLLDPPDVFSKSAPPPVALPEAKPRQEEPKPVVRETPPAAPAASAPESRPAVTRGAASPVPAQASAKPKAGEKTRLVKPGDTLARIAQEHRPEGVNLDQMLVALFQNNRDAFAGNNMNRLKAGKILAIPEADAAAAVAPAEARKTVVAQARDFNAYRRKLAAAVAAAPVKEEAAKQQDTGRIAPKVEDKVPEPAPSRDKLEVSRTETPKDGKGIQKRIEALEEDLVARDKSLKEASSRVAELEKNLADLKKLAEMKSQVGAQMQAQAEAGKPAPEAVAPTKPAEAPPADARGAERPAEAAAMPAKAEDAAKPVPAPAPAAVQPEPKPAPAPAPAAHERGFVDENPELVYGGGGIVALLLGWLGYSAWRRRREQATEPPPLSGTLGTGDMPANSVFGSTGGQSVNTGASIQTDFSQASLTSLGAEEGVDPVAEADVYMAYGRDAQAEEILLEALKQDPARQAIYLKLLEIYFGRKDARQFESVAKSLRERTGGAGPDWEKAAEMGRALDPDNPLYAHAGGMAAAAGPATVPLGTAPAAGAFADTALAARDTVVLPPGQFASMAAATEDVPAVPGSVDFEIDLGPAPGTATTEPAKPELPEVLDFDLGIDTAGAASPAAAFGEPDITLPSAGMTPGAPPAGKASGEAVAGTSGLDFEFDLDIPSATPSKTPDATPDATAEAPSPAGFDFSAIDLELAPQPSEAAIATAAEAAAAGGEEAAGVDNPDVATKLELAQAYQEMGDAEGARELLQEVLQEGSARQRAMARDKLAALGA